MGMNESQARNDAPPLAVARPADAQRSCGCPAVQRSIQRLNRPNYCARALRPLGAAVEGKEAAQPLVQKETLTFTQEQIGELLANAREQVRR